MKLLYVMPLLLTACYPSDSQERMVSRLCEEVEGVAYSAAVLKDLGADKESVMLSLGQDFQDNQDFYSKIESLINNIWLTPSNQQNIYYRTPEDISEEIGEHCLNNPNLYLDI